jgi:hypothetical protein
LQKSDSVSRPLSGNEKKIHGLNRCVSNFKNWNYFCKKNIVASNALNLKILTKAFNKNKELFYVCELILKQYAMSSRFGTLVFFLLR